MVGLVPRNRGFILVVDLGGSSAHLAARRLRELGVYTELASAYISPGQVLDVAGEAQAIVVAGGPSVSPSLEPTRLLRELAETGRQILGIGLGHLVLAKTLGATVEFKNSPGHGPGEVELEAGDKLFAGLPSRLRVLMEYTGAVLEPPPGSRILAHNPYSPVAGFRLGSIYSIQWHPWDDTTGYGLQLLSNWLDLVGAERSWKPEDLVGTLVEEVRKSIGEGRAVAAVSGGVDSTVAALIAQRAIGDRLRVVLIDHGLHPVGEPEHSIRLLQEAGLKPVVVDAREEFLSALETVEDPEEKRRVFGRLYAEVLAREARAWGAEYLVQGTIYPDIVESGGRPGLGLVKSHHNVAGLPGNFGLKIVEPLKWFYKDEVRRIALKLGVPREIVYKQPQPGPALTVRIEGRVTREKLEILKRADRIVREEVERRGLEKRLWQYFAILTASKATGVKKGGRAYGYVVVVRIVESLDAMTATPAKLSWDVLESIASRITGEIPEVTRVVYDVTPKPPATIEWE